MKKIVSTLLAVVLILGTIFTLVSCGKTLSGTYKADAGFASAELTFSGNKVTKKTTIAGFAKEYTAKYEINEDAEKEGKFTITFIYEDGAEEDDDIKGTLPFSEVTENGKDYIIIGIIKYVKQ